MTALPTPLPTSRPKQYWSPSSIRAWECPARGAMRDLAGLVGESSEAARVGQWTHKVFAEYARHLVAESLQTDLSAMRDIARRVLTEAGVPLAAMRELLDAADGFAETNVFHPARIIGIESPNEFTTPGGRLIRYRADLVAWTDESTLAIIDHKGAYSLPTEDELRRDVQANVNVLGELARHDDQDGAWFIRNHWRYREERRVFISRDGADDFAVSLDARLSYLESLIAKGGPFDAVPGGDTCDWCDYVRRCPLPDEVRPPVVASLEDAVRLGGQAYALRTLANDLLRGVQAWTDANGSIECPGGGRYGYWPSVSVKADPRTLTSTLPGDAGWDLLRVDARGLRRAMRDEMYGALLAGKVEETTKTTFGFRKGRPEEDNEDA